ncbi:hypothetical protein LOTGIDRAFT_230500 [Lottia gigantea]|uniref:Uncharacterized protein n=1 Tax=Lottia gigantea TaxID=225164 RepID=V4AGB5_LOTGI|nr:hypothetical protein LOTGIDRAFT_230500 [Lottia gigantea]ESP03084.1 hypothetical protein LOTGIDRAFT_230500 [Lottia gigantea]
MSGLLCCYRCFKRKKDESKSKKHNSSPVELDSQQPNTIQKSDESEASVSMPVSTASSNPASKLLDSQSSSHNKQEIQQSNDTPIVEVSSDMAEVATLNPEDTTRKMRPLKTSNSGADITLGLEDADGTTAEVEIDVNDNESEIAPEEIPRGKVRKASIVEKLSKTKASEAYVATVKSSAEQRAKDFEKLLNEHAEIVQEIGRTASAENLTSDERDP